MECFYDECAPPFNRSGDPSPPVEYLSCLALYSTVSHDLVCYYVNHTIQSKMLSNRL